MREKNFREMRRKDRQMAEEKVAAMGKMMQGIVPEHKGNVQISRKGWL